MSMIGWKRGFGYFASGTFPSSSRKSLGQGWSKKFDPSSSENDAGMDHTADPSTGRGGSGPQPVAKSAASGSRKTDEMKRNARMGKVCMTHPHRDRSTNLSSRQAGHRG